MTQPHLMPLAIRACALLTPLDNAKQNTWQALCDGQRVTTKTAVEDALLAGDPSLDRSIRLALAVAQKVLADCPAIIPADDTALFCATSKGPILTFLQACQRLREGQLPTENQARHLMLGTGAMGPILAKALATRLSLAASPRHLVAPSAIHTSVAACASGLHALHRAAAALRRDECQRAIVVAADASLHPLFEASFQRLGVLSPVEPDGSRRCQPFGEQGAGFFVTEAAAALILEKPSTASPPPLAYLHQTLIAADSTALVAIDPHSQSLRRALQKITANQTPSFIHAHATGTAHDPFELAAIQTIATPQTPIYSCKSSLGHSLGAASLVSFAISTLAHAQRRLPDGTPVPPNATSLTIAQGFGGHIAIASLHSAIHP